jgi:hypothetical protein
LLKRGERRISIDVPPGPHRTDIVAELIGALHLRTLILSGNLAKQADWFDRYAETPSPFVRAMQRIWEPGVLPPVSALSYSCAPVILMNAARFPDNGVSASAVSEEVDRMVRHLHKHHYRLIVIDAEPEVDEQWQQVMDHLREHSDVMVIVLHTTAWAARNRVCDGLKGALSGNTAPILPAVMAAGTCLPWRHLYYQLVMDNDGNTGHHDAALQTAHNGQTNAAVMDIVLHEIGFMKDDMRCLVVIPDLYVTDEEKWDDQTMQYESVLKLMQELSAMNASAPARPVFLTGHSIVCPTDISDVLLDRAKEYMKQQGWNAALELIRQDTCDELMGDGLDWNSRIYVVLIAHLMARGWIRCAIAEYSLLVQGWHSLFVNTVVLASQFEEPPLFNYLHDTTSNPGDAPWKLVHCWHVVTTPPYLDRSSAEHAGTVKAPVNLIGPAVDGCLCTGLPTSPDPGLAGPQSDRRKHDFNSRMLELVAHREAARKCWDAVNEAEGTLYRSIRLSWSGHDSKPIPAVQEASILAQMDAYSEYNRMATARLTLGGSITAALVVAAILLLPTSAGWITGLLLAATYAGVGGIFVARKLFARPAIEESSKAELIRRCATAVMESVEHSRKAERELRFVETVQNSLRICVMLRGEEQAEQISDAIVDMLAHPPSGDRVLLVFDVDLGTTRMKNLLDAKKTYLRFRPAYILPIPPFALEDADALNSLVESMRRRVGYCEVRDKSREDDDLRQLPAEPVADVWDCTDLWA